MTLEVLHYVAGIALLLGAAFVLVAALGILRLPDLYTRMHAASKAGTVGSGLTFTAVAVASLEGPIILRAVLGFLFILITTPISAHLLARAAYLTGVRPSELTVIDELRSSGSNKR